MLLIGAILAWSLPGALDYIHFLGASGDAGAALAPRHRLFLLRHLPRRDARAPGMPDRRAPAPGWHETL